MNRCCLNIALVNELKRLSLRKVLDIYEVIESAATKRFDFMPYHPGLGGHYIPVGLYYRSWNAREYGFAARFIELAAEINPAMPYNVVERLVSALNSHEKSVKGSKILLLGVAYQKDVDELRKSTSLTLLKLLTAGSAKPDYNDLCFPSVRAAGQCETANPGVTRGSTDNNGLIWVCPMGHVACPRREANFRRKRIKGKYFA